MKIEDILDKLNKEKHLAAVVILKANEGYSAIPMAKEIYRTFFLLQEHLNGKTIKEALLKLLKKGD